MPINGIEPLFQWRVITLANNKSFCFSLRSTKLLCRQIKNTTYPLPILQGRVMWLYNPHDMPDEAFTDFALVGSVIVPINGIEPLSQGGPLLA